MKKTEEKKDKKIKKGFSLRFPANLLAPVGEFLQNKLKKLEIRKKEVDDDDPFKDSARLLDNASPDTDAAEQFGHARADAIKKELQLRIKQTKKALERVKRGKYPICEDCGKMIDTDRLIVYPEATKCVKCVAKRES